MKGKGGGEGGEKRTEMEMYVTPQQDTCIWECRCVGLGLCQKVMRVHLVGFCLGS